METCADCGKPIEINQPSYYRIHPACCIGKTYHSGCGDPFGHKAALEAKDAEIASLKADKDVIRSQERNGSYERDIDALEAEIAHIYADRKAWANVELSEENDRLIDHVAKLQAALKAILKIARDALANEQRVPQGEE